jgi:hypothetical protein
VVLDGEAKALRENEDVKEFYLGISDRGRRSFRDVKHYKRRKRWLGPGGWMMDAAARSLGCAVVPGGVGNSEQQVQAIAHFRPSGYTGTPDFLKVLLDKGGELGLDCASITRALVSGERPVPGPEAGLCRARRRRAAVLCHGRSGLIAYESEAREGMILDEASSWRSCAPAPATRSPTARSARWW